MPDHPLKRAVERLVDEETCDVYLYAGSINRSTCDFLIGSCPEDPRPKALLILSSYGGDAHAAYRLTRHLQDMYKGEFTLLIPSMCKSAGTLVAIGADELVMSPLGELGPLDVQVSERDELWERRSGLVPTQALETIGDKAFSFFESAFINLRTRSGSQITTRTAAEIASRLTIGLFRPLVSQIDPLRVADILLSMRIAEEYGNILSTSNVKENSISQLVYGYPSHGYILDRREAAELFENVRSPSQPETELIELIIPIIDNVLEGEEAFGVQLSGQEFLETLSSLGDAADEEPQDDLCQEDESGSEAETQSEERHD